MSATGELELSGPAEGPHEAHRVYNPSALGGGLHRFWSLTFMLARTEFKLRFFGSVFGYLWTLMRPLMLFGVMLFVFTQIFKINKAHPYVHHYAEYLLESIILYTYFQEATGGAVASLVAREGILRRLRFPRLVIPLSVALYSLFNLGMNLIVVFIFILASGVDPTVRWLELIPIVGLLVFFATGVGMLLSALYVRFRDVQPIWEVFLQIFYYGSPIIYTVNAVPANHILGVSFKQILALNPLGALLTQLRHALLQPGAPTALDAAGGLGYLLIPFGIIVLVFVVGLWYFYHEAPLISEKL